MKWFWALRCWVRGQHQAVFVENKGYGLNSFPDHWACLGCDELWMPKRTVPLTEAEKKEQNKLVRQGPFPR